ncbi:MAG: ABC-type glycerol-3-phosphate transport system substrate-binding protein [Patiriisocius sp.]|jgi:ABC-type glycerol-3-phosphate transport system substrate-binding protein
MMNLRPFQIILLAGFGFMAFAALILLANFQSTPSQEEVAYGKQVIVWGTLPGAVFDLTFRAIVQEDDAFGVVKYYEIDERDFDDDLINAIAEGRSPDMIILKSDSLVKHRAKLLPIPYESIPLGTYRNTYVDGADIFALKDGIYAMPFAVDPLLMYWNRDTFSSRGFAQAPRNWAEITSQVVPRITVTDSNRNITQSAVSFGEFRNVTHAKDILMLLAIQTGSSMVTENDRGYVVGVNKSEGPTLAPLESAMSFYTGFSDVNSTLYNWNRAMPTDKNAFISGDLALYFGLGSEAPDIDQKNPNLNFDVTTVPQGSAATALRTYGDFYGFAIPRASANPQGAFAAMSTISSARFVGDLTVGLNMAPVRRDVVGAGDTGVYRSTMLQSALIARGWLDPNPDASDSILMQMVEDVVSNRSRISQAVSDAVNRLILEY